MHYSAEFVPPNDRPDEKPKTTPLLFWDYYMMAYQDMKIVARDLFLFQKLSARYQWQLNWNMISILKQQSQTVLITDLNNTIIFASGNIRHMTGYFAHEVIGKTPKIFQGKETSPQSRKIIRQAVQNRQSFQIVILNYKKNGDTYLCKIEGHPLLNHQNELTNFIAFEHPHPAKA